MGDWFLRPAISHQLMCWDLKMLGAASESYPEKAICFCKLAVQEGLHGQQAAWLPCAALCLHAALGGSSHFSSREAKVCLVINVCGSCNICVSGTWKKSDLWDWRLAWWGGEIPKLHSSLLWFYTCVLFDSILFITVDCLASLNTCSLSPSSAWTEWEQERGNGGRELPACMRKASKKGSDTGRKAGTETAPRHHLCRGKYKR